MILPLLQLCFFHAFAVAAAGASKNPSSPYSNLLAALNPASEKEDESLLLLSFKAAITGDPLGALQTWRNGSSPCSSWKGITCGANGFVSAVNLTGLQLFGSFYANTISDLRHLTSLDLSNNVFTGSLPPSFGRNLTVLNLFNNSFSGGIPPALSNSTSLVKISLYLNSLTGPIPPELGSLSNLEYLALSFNHLNGSLPIPILTNCTKLTTLALSLNSFSGPLPPEIGKLTNLKNLWLDHNFFSGSVPAELGNLTQLSLLQLDTNNLTGSIPPSLGQLTSLTELLSLSINQLSGSIPLQLGKLSNLTILTLRGNFLSGTIPKELGNMQSIQGLFLEENILEGNIPADLANCTNLQQLRLDKNRLTGSIPELFGSLQHLTRFYVHDNMLQGPIPTRLGNLSRLQDLSLGFNAFQGPIPQLLATLTTVVFNFSMPSNHLNGTIPSGLGQMIHVQNIDLSANTLMGRIPVDIGDCTSLTHLNLSNNSLIGEIPESFAQLQSLQMLDLSQNSISGGIPTWLTNFTQLQHIDLSNNDFTGPIPSSGVFAKINATSFLNNPGLCGPPLSNACTVSTIAAQASTGGGLDAGFKVLIAVACFLFVCLVLVFIMCSRRMKKVVAASPRGLPNEVPEFSMHLRRFTVKELEVATENFSESRLIGIGGVSKVYRATNVIISMAPTIQQVDAAVKVLSINHSMSFSTELIALGSIRHRNLVRLYGFCMYRNLYACVLELLTNGSLQDRLYGPGAESLSIQERLSIALDVAHGLAYLHHGLRRSMVHRDVKPSNILFDQDKVARVSDFGIAKLLNQDEVFSKARGTIGYVAPEYGESTRVETKGDVYSFGVVLLEMLTKKRPTDDHFGTMEVSLPMWVRDAYPDRTLEILDPQLVGPELVFTIEDEEATKTMVEVALSCTEVRPHDRPDMETVVRKLTSISSFLSSSVLSQRKSSFSDGDVALLKG
ncbi:hypothetical protein L7F22_023863 [Adiantum nelumboides]|nr:hypothetical protein [Adiantum nelumboides]